MMQCLDLKEKAEATPAVEQLEDANPEADNTDSVVIDLESDQELQIYSFRKSRRCSQCLCQSCLINKCAESSMRT